MSTGFQSEVISLGGGQPQQVLAAISPTLVIGLGGSGKGVVMRLRRMFYERYGTTRFPMLAHLVIDSDQQDGRDIGGAVGGAMHSELKLSAQTQPPEFINCMLGVEGYNRYFRAAPAAHPHIFSWLSPTMDQFGHVAVAHGCGMHRPFGRLSFFHHFPTIRSAIREHLAAIRTAAALDPTGREWAPPGTNATTDPQRIEVVIVHSIAGGTGAGMFLDANFLVRKIINEDFPGTPTHICNIAILPGMLRGEMETRLAQQWNRAKSNSYACLMEMEHYSMRRWDRYAVLGRCAQDMSEARRGGDNQFEVTWDPNDPLYSNLHEPGPPWDTCYLIDNRNERCHADLDPAQVFEMVAEYLMLDFEPTAFGEAKRSFRPNAGATLLTRDYAEHVPESRHPIFSNIYSCRFSSFGLAQIYYDRDRLRRAMALRTAQRLVQRQLGETPDGDQLLHRGEQDFAQSVPLGVHDDVRFTVPFVFDETFRTRDGNSLLALAEAEYRELQSKGAPARFGPRFAALPHVRRIEELNRVQRQRLQPPSEDGSNPGGEATVNMVSRAAQLRHRLEERLRALADRAFAADGARFTLALLEEYERRLTALVGEVAKIGQTTPAAERSLTLRLEEVDALPHMKKMARAIEFGRAVEWAWRRHASVCYQVRAASILCDLLGSLVLFLRGTIRPHYQAVREALDRLVGDLREKFADATVAPLAVRNYLLWTPREESDYDKRLREILEKVCLGRGSHGVDWKLLEADAYKGLAKNPDYLHYTDRLAASRRLVPRDAPPHVTALGTFADCLARACYDIVAGFQDDFNAVDSLLDPYRDPAEFDEAIRLITERSDPYLPRDSNTDAGRVPGRKVDLSLMNPDPTKSAKVTNVIVGRYGVNLGQTLAGEPDAVVLYQELSGLPLCLYGRLRELSAAYETADPQLCHIDFRGTKLRLPDIERVTPEVYRTILQCAPDILFAMMIGHVILNQDSVFTLRQQLGMTERWLPLASHLDRVIKEVAKSESLFREVHELRKTWLLDADQRGAETKARMLATLLVGTQSLMEMATEAIPIGRSNARVANPIYNSAEHNAAQLCGLLGGWGRGQEYQAAYDFKQPTCRKDLVRQARERCFRSLHPDFPIPVLVDLVPVLEQGPATVTAAGSQ